MSVFDFDDAFVADDPLNGSGDEPSRFVVTKHELEEVARYWFNVRLRDTFWDFCVQEADNWREIGYCVRRLAAIAEVLGTERVKAIGDEVTEAFQKTADPTAWRLFMTGTQEECAAFFDQQHLLSVEFRTNPFEVCIRLPQGERVRQVVFSLCSEPVSGTRNPDEFCCRYATRAEAEDLVQRLTTLRIPGLAIEIRERDRHS